MGKLIKGVIYDDKHAIKEAAYSTAYVLSDFLKQDTLDKIYNDNKICECPTRDQFLTSVIADFITRPEDGFENMIIPSHLVDDKLYRELKKIDIGESLVKSFIQICCDDFANGNDETHLELEDGDCFCFRSKDELLAGLDNLYNAGKIALIDIDKIKSFVA